MNEISKTRSNLFYISLICIQGLIFGIGNPIVKFAYESITPIWLLTIRFSFAALVFLLFCGKTVIPELKRTKIKTWLPTSLCMAGAYITCNVALDLTTATGVGFLMSLSIIFTPPLARLVLGRKVRRGFIPVPILAVTGMWLFSMNGGGFQFGWGEFLALTCSFFMAGALVWGEESLDTMSPGAVSVVQMVVTAVISFLCALLLEPLPEFGAIETKAWLIILYLALFCSCVCYILQNIALAKLPAAIVSLTQCSEPLFTAVFAFFILGETLSPLGFVGAALLMACIIYGNYSESKNNTKEITP